MTISSVVDYLLIQHSKDKFPDAVLDTGSQLLAQKPLRFLHQCSIGNCCKQSSLSLFLRRKKWNVELEAKAQILSDQCRVGHDTNDDRKIPAFQYVGQNWAGAKDINT
ncbi:unnamed protein product [Schistosoma intercalatum]|nr:unnamed protein product [Schistosoma intercalatum]